MNILSIDPGITTGIAVKSGNIYKTMELKPYTVLWKYVQGGQWDQVICENFTAQDISKYGITTVRIIGGIEAICMLREIPLAIQQNVMRVPFKPKALEMIGKKPRDHELDSLAHLLFWESKNVRAE